jgi:ATP-dependent DNA ligase
MRRGFDWSGRFPWIGDVLRSLQSATIDGEAVWCGPDGISDFENVVQNLERDRCPVS